MVKPKILIIHGWNYKNYTSFKILDAWSNRSELVEELSKYFLVVKVNLPGFCGQADPQYPWNLDDYVYFVDRIIKEEKPDCILGYSFGGAIVLRWKKMTLDVKIKAFLVAPAIIRKYESGDLKGFQNIFKAVLPNKFIHMIRDFYLINIIKNLYYSQATKIMRQTYKNIVSLDLRNDLIEVPDSITLIYGDYDTATPVGLIHGTLFKVNNRHKLKILHGGGHDIATTHPRDIATFISGVV